MAQLTVHELVNSTLNGIRASIQSRYKYPLEVYFMNLTPKEQFENKMPTYLVLREVVTIKKFFFFKQRKTRKLLAIHPGLINRGGDSREIWGHVYDLSLYDLFAAELTKLCMELGATKVDIIQGYPRFS